MDETKTRWYRWVADHSRYFFWLLWGAFVGAFGGAVLNLGKPLYEWQTLVAGLFAIVAAYIALQGVHRQIDATHRQIEAADRLAEERRRREERAAVVVLPLALAQLSQYARESIQLLEPWTWRAVDVAARTASGPVNFRRLEVPRIPETVISAMQLCARYAEGSNVERLAKALGKLQVQRSRLTGWVERVNNASGVDESRRIEGLGCMEDAADLHAAIDELYPYARDNELIRQKTTLEQLTTALHNSGLWFDNHPIWEEIRRGRGVDVRPQGSGGSQE